MVNHGAVRSTVKPKELVIDEFSAWVNSNITEVNENVGEENEFIGYQYDCVQYEKNEYFNIENPTMEERLQALEMLELERVLGGI